MPFLNYFHRTWRLTVPESETLVQQRLTVVIMATILSPSHLNSPFFADFPVFDNGCKTKGNQMTRPRLIVIYTTMAFAAGSAASTSYGADAGAITVNPFYNASTLPFQAPPFDKIKDG